jgi:ubiquinone/menaquinone biosynthesis C-methylase UbiE
VIEHVQNQTSVLNEALRVLKPGGAIYVACPNYLRFYEPHYKVLFFPLLPKFLASFYLRMRRRDPVLLRQLTYTTNRRVRRLLRKLNLHFMDLNERGFLDKCIGQKSRAATKKARAVQLLAGLPIVSKLVFFAASAYIQLREGGSEFLAFRESRG